MKFNNTITLIASLLAILTYFGITLNAETQRTSSALIATPESASSSTDKGTFVVKIGEDGQVSAGMSTHDGVATSTASGKGTNASGASPHYQSSTSRRE